MFQRRPLQVGRQRYIHRLFSVDVRWAYPEAQPRPLAMPRVTHAGTTVSVNTHVTERDPYLIHASREINPDGHTRPIGRLDGSPRRGARDEEVRVRPGEPHRVDHRLNKVCHIRHHEFHNVTDSNNGITFDAIALSCCNFLRPMPTIT